MPPRSDDDLPADAIPNPRSSDTFTMRAPCGNDGSTEGYISRRSHQDVVYCRRCDRYQYCAPRRETGAPAQSTRSRATIKPSQRARVFARDGARCVLCGRSAFGDDVVLHVGHLISVEQGPELGVSAADLAHDSNLAVMCGEDNYGLGKQSVSARLIAALVVHEAQRDRLARGEAS